MATLSPYPLEALLRRSIREPEQKQSLFDLPLRRIPAFSAAHDIHIEMHGQKASSPLGPAAGPHTQLAQNIALSWLAGGRIIELKTIQIKDELIIPRPCIDMATVGYNVEWSQELKLEQSLEEYVKASMLIEMLKQNPALGALLPFGDTLFEVSVGYDLPGIQSERVGHFLHAIGQATDIVQMLRRQIPDDLKQYRDLPFTETIARSVTISTFHGCPPKQIEEIAKHILQHYGYSCTLKLNPTLLGQKEANSILHDMLGYHDIQVPSHAFENDPSFDQIAPMIERLSNIAQSLGLGFGVKLTNTLVVQNHRNFFPSDQKEMYLSGPPLHVLAMHLVRQFRRTFGNRIPLSFSGGIDALNFPDAVALGLLPVTVCTDWLKTGGYARAHRYYEELYARMDRCQAQSRGDFILRAYQRADDISSDTLPLEQRLAEAVVRNTERYVESLAQNGRYASPENTRTPKKIGKHLSLFDCIACDKCVPVCPNDANFVLAIKPAQIPLRKAKPSSNGFEIAEHGQLHLSERHQIANFIDFCNECGNCDIFCPEDGGPYLLKPRFFGSRTNFETSPETDGFFAEEHEGLKRISGRFRGALYCLQIQGNCARYLGPGFELEYQIDHIDDTLHGHCEGEADLGYAEILKLLLDAVFSANEVNFVNCLKPNLQA